MPDPRSTLVTFPLNLGMDNVSFDESVQPAGPKPRLVMSRNTRLSKVPGVVSKAPGSTAILTTSQQDKGGAIPLGMMDSTLLPASAESNSTRRSTGDAVVALGAQSDSFYAQSAYYPAQVTSAGVLPGSNTMRTNASCAYQASTGWTFYVTVRTDLINVGAYLTVIADDGRIIVPLQFLADMPGIAGTQNYAAVTVHGDNVVLWYSPDNVTLSAALLTTSAVTLSATIGTPATIHTFTASWTQMQVQIACDDNDTANAYVVVPSNAGADLQVKRIAIPALTITTTSTQAGEGGRFHAICYRNGIVLVASSNTATNTTLFEFTSALALSWSTAGLLSDGQVSCGLETYGGVDYRVFACSACPILGSPAYGGTLVHWYAAGGGQFANGMIRNQTLVGQIACYRASDGTYISAIPTQVIYDASDARGSYDPNSDDFLPDPSIELVRMVYLTYGSTSLQASVVARVGTDLAIRYPGILTAESVSAARYEFYGCSNSTAVSGQRVLVTYLAENVEEGNVAAGYAARYVWLTFGSVQPRFAHTAEGAAIVAGALPTVWDGHGAMEFSPMRQPRLVGTTTGGTGAALSGAPATYSFAAVTAFDDAQGQTHRSPPSSVVELTGTGIQPTLTVKLPVTYRDIAGQSGIQVVIYASEPDGLTPYAQRYWLDTLGTYSPDDEETLIDSIAQPVVDAFHPAIYTLGGPTEPLATFCPNACLDVQVIADRVWMLDAERPWIWWYSKPKESGFFAEMCPDLYVTTPSSAGLGVAISEWSGNPVFLTERGIWTVSGEGPDALLNPPLFSSAAQVSDIACTQRNSVVRSPAGVMFVSNNRFVRFKGQMFEYPEINATAYGDVIGTAVFRNQQEVVFFCAQGYAYVYNWVADAWTLWDTDVTGISALTGCAQRADGKVLLVSETAVRLLDPESVSTAADIYLETGWIVLGGPQDHNTIDNLVMHAKRASEHALSIGIAVDYKGTTITRSYTTANVLASVTDSTTTKRYDLLPQCPEQKARAIKLSITESEASGEAFQPVNLTIEMIKQQGRLSQSIRDQARK